MSLPAMTVVGKTLDDRFMPEDSIVVSRLKLCEYSGVVEPEWIYNSKCNNSLTGPGSKIMSANFRQP